MAALAFSSLAPLWLGSRGVGRRVWGGGGWGALIGRALQCFQKHSSGSITQCDEEKRPAANESQQCLLLWTTT